MSGFKEATLYLKPKVYITFDGDDFDSGTGELTSVGRAVMDETGNGNHGILHDDADPQRGYWFGSPSLCNLEPAGYGIRMGFGKIEGHSSGWPHSFIEIPYSGDFAFPSQEFTVSLLYRKVTNEQQFRVDSGNITASLSRPIASKGAIFNLYYLDSWSGSDTLQVVHPGGSMQWVLDSFFYNDVKHLVFTWKIEYDPLTGNSVGVAKLFINGVIVATTRTNYAFPTSPPNLNDPLSAWYLGGTNAPDGTLHNNKATSHTEFDAFSVFDRALSDIEVGWLFKKTLPYEGLIQNARPTMYWQMGESSTAESNVFAPTIGSYSGQYLGGLGKIEKGLPGPPQIPLSLAPRFTNGGMGVVHRESSGGYVTLFSPSADYTCEFWFRCETGSKAILLSTVNDDLPFSGIMCQANVLDNFPTPGGIQFNVSRDIQISWQGGIHDNQWHHCALIRRGVTMELWVDGVMRKSQEHTITNPGTPGQLYLMNSSPGGLEVQGQMCQLVLYTRALLEHELITRFSYGVLYRVRGTVTLQGVPHSATIRAYRNSNGEKIAETVSNVSDGSYEIRTQTNDRIDVLVLNPKNPDIRYRAFGPIVPSSFIDSPV